MKAGRLIGWRDAKRSRPPTLGEVLGALALFATLAALGWVVAATQGVR